MSELWLNLRPFTLRLRTIDKEAGVRIRYLRQRGQGMTEYIIIVALVAVAAIAVYQLFGQVVRSQNAAMAKALAGEAGSEQSRFAQSAAEAAAAQTDATQHKSLDRKSVVEGQRVSG